MCDGLLVGNSSVTNAQNALGGVEKRILAVYSKTLDWFLRWRFVSIVIWILCLAGTGYFFWKVPKEFIPPGDSGTIFGIFMGRGQFTVQAGATAEPAEVP